MTMARKLNLGSGRVYLLEGFENLDRSDGREAYPLADVEDGSCSEIRASHVLEHFGHREVSAVVKHWVAKLAPGGSLRIAVPDFERVAREYLAGVPIDVQGYTMGGHVDGDDRHGAIFDGETLTELLADAGLERIRRWESEADDCAALPVSLNLMGYKPSARPAGLDDVSAVMASARFGPALHHRCVYEAMERLRISYTVTIGCFWHQILSEAIESLLERTETEYILTLDFDTVFSPEDVLELHRLMRAYPDADAVCALQSKRSCRDALFTIAGPDGVLKKEAFTADFQRNLVKVTTGHFGLTMFRASKLRGLARPWMNPEPNSGGRWGEGRVDADISFWRNWEAGGNSLWLAPRVVVGHLEELVTWPDGQFQPVRQGFDEYMAEGKPAGVIR